MADYAHPEMLVTTSWAKEHLDDPKVRFVEVDVDTFSYEEGHLPGALGWDWTTQLCDVEERDILSKEAFEELMASSGIGNDTTVVLYGDNNNWFAAWGLWQMKIYGHQDVRLMDGGRRKWLEEGLPLTRDTAKVERAEYTAKNADTSLRAFMADVRAAQEKQASAMVDVRSPAEFSGELLAPPGLNETCQRGGHVPGAANVPWGLVCNDDGTFKSADELKSLYGGKGVTGDKPVIAYCRIGERSSHTWFTLKYLVGYDDVRNYDGSWTEWGNLVGAPIERGAR